MTTDPGVSAELPFLHVALPVLDEAGFLERFLQCLTEQSYARFKIYICVNQPDTWWDIPEKRAVCEHNAASLNILNEYQGLDIEVIDRSSRGKGWTGRQYGVGYARKAVMDRISSEASPNDILVSMDADSTFPSTYLESVALNFAANPGSAALAVPYFHPKPADSRAARAIFRYEIYMRCYLLNLLRIGSPYAFTALGSAMALPVWAYRAIGGMTPKMSGEDFYFLQKLRKYGEVLIWNETVVYPEARFSDRVFFGTGPAMIRGAGGDWSGYPVYPCALFDEILETYRLIPELFEKPVDTPIMRFLAGQFKTDDPLQPLRRNHREPERFSRGFHEKFDGLRILQYLKSENRRFGTTDEETLCEYLMKYHPAKTAAEPGLNLEKLSFSDSSLEDLEKVRDFLFRLEMEARFISAHA